MAYRIHAAPERASRVFRGGHMSHLAKMVKASDPQEGKPMATINRRRSFVERFILGRVLFFDAGHEAQQAIDMIGAALTVFERIEERTEQRMAKIDEQRLAEIDEITEF